MLTMLMSLYYAKSTLADADVVIVGIPLDRTSSFASGTRFGPDVTRLAADNIETFSPYLGRDVTSINVHDFGNIQLSFEAPEAPIRRIVQAAQELATDRRRLVAIGGEHTITPALVSGAVGRYADLCVIQFDAHSDLRDEYLGERVCHATAMSRVLDVVPRSRLFQLGIRSFYQAAEMTAENLFPFEVVESARRVRDLVGSRPLYLTLDIDVLDPGLMTDVQTPQPGGCNYNDLVRALATFDGANVVGCDLVEVCPRTAQPSAGACVAAELVRELVLLCGPR
jgi:agmatinase